MLFTHGVSQVSVRVLQASYGLLVYAAYESLIISFCVTIKINFVFDGNSIKFYPQAFFPSFYSSKLEFDS